jgi:hypothetical protein
MIENYISNDDIIDVACYIHLDWRNKDIDEYVVKTVKDLSLSAYIISREISTKRGHPHYHFYMGMNDEKIYDKFIRDIKKKFPLRGRALKNAPKNYGRVRNIKNKDSMKAYTIKDGNYEYHGYTEEQMMYYKSLSYRKEETAKGVFEQCQHAIEGLKDTKKVCYKILEIYRENDRIPTRNTIYNLLWWNKNIDNERYLGILGINELYEFNEF